MVDKEIQAAYDLFEKYKSDISKNPFLDLDIEIQNLFDDIIEQYQILMKPDEILYRGRRHENRNEKNPFSSKEIGMPPIEFSGKGRVHREGMQMFYLAGSKSTVISEVRAKKGEIITIGTFKNDKCLNVLEIGEDGASMGWCGEEETKSGKSRRFVLFFATYFNIGFSKLIENKEEYLPTQIFAEYCRSKDIDGIAYPSSLIKKEYKLGNLIKPNYNYAFFDDKGIICINRELIKLEEKI